MSIHRRLLARAALLVVTAASLIVLGAAPSSACSCAAPLATDALDEHDVAFSAVVLGGRKVDDEAIDTMRVRTVFKGDVPRKVDVVGPELSSMCGLASELDDEVVVFGDLVDGEVTSNGCLTTVAPSREYRQLIADLGTGTEPEPGHLKAERDRPGLSYDQFSAGRALLGVAGLSVMGFFVFRSWRARRRAP